MWYNTLLFGLWRSWLARQAGGLKVAGSSPASPTMSFLCYLFVLTMSQLEKQVQFAREEVGWLNLDDWGCIAVRGKDRLPFLQALISNDVIGLKVNGICRAALLEKNSHIIAPFWVSKAPQRLYLIIQKKYCAKVLQQLEGFIFAEEVQLNVEDKELLYLQGPNLPTLFAQWGWPGYEKNTFIDFKALNKKAPFREIEGLHCLSLTADEGAIVLTKNQSELTKALKEKNIPQMSLRAWEVLRVEAGVGLMGIDFDERHLLLEVDALDEMVSVTKGCYPGQETVARTLSRGSVQKKLFGLKHQNENLGPGSLLYARGKKVAEISTTVYSPTLKMYLSLALLSREFWYQGREYRLETTPGDFKSRVAVGVEKLPFYFGKNLLASAKSYLDRGLAAYHQSDYDKARELLHGALSRHARFPDAVEALAVIEERLGDIEKAIELNKRFSVLEPNAVMAHTNLSRLYMKKGWIEKAEEEQKQATLLGYKYGRKESDPKEMEALRQKAEAGRRAKIEMFQKVLEIDPQDEIANFGLGKLYWEQKRYAAARGHLEKVVAGNPNYSAAYDVLGKSLVGLNEKDEAKRVLTKGIQVAAQQGDLTPKKSMEELLRHIDASVSTA